MGNCCSPSEALTLLPETTVWESPSPGYKSIRIPAIVKTRRNTLVAFSEGRVHGRADHGAINVLMKRSVDSGQTWSDDLIIWSDGNNTCGNPCAVVDEDTGTIWLALTWNSGNDTERQIMDGSSSDARHVYMTKSTDDGQTWHAPWKISDTVRQPHWRWYATGPGNGIQLTQGSYKGRLLIPCNHSDHSDPSKHPYRSHVIFSDDHGETWKLGGVHEDKTNESAIVELADGSVLQSMRSYHRQETRAMAASMDGGLSFGPLSHAAGIKTFPIQGSILRAQWPEDGKKSKIVLANATNPDRTHLMLYVSYDEGKTWPVSRLVYGGGAAYSHMVKLADDNIGLLYEKDYYKTLSFAVFDMDWLEQGKGGV